MSGKQQSKGGGGGGGGGGTFSHSQSQPGDNTSILMGLSAGIIWPQMFFPPASSLSAWSLSRRPTYPNLLPTSLPFAPRRRTNLFGLVSGRWRVGGGGVGSEHNEDVRQKLSVKSPSSSPVRDKPRFCLFP